MHAFILKRVLQALPLLLGVATLLFVILHLAPGDPTSVYFSPDIDPQVLEQMRRNLGLDQPIHVQYGRWLWSFMHGDFGHSFAQRRPVADVLADAIPNTLLLSAVAIVIIFVVGVLVGTVQAVRQYSFADNVATVVSFFFYSMPSFWFALMLMLLLSYKFQLLPASQMTSVSYEYLPPLEKVWDRLRHLVMPALALGIGTAAGVARYARGNLLEVIRQDYIRTARAKGLPERTVIFKHAMRNALIPVITLFGLYVPLLLGGAVLIETIYAWPGMGRVIVTAIFQRDYPVVMATTFLFSIFVILGNLLADVLYAVVDPRIRYD
ncbi:MAG: ABC transporter permease [Gemmatimonadetes bacterium]|nr:ABC transporter permease [Gemmatimonadota bacterium]